MSRKFREKNFINRPFLPLLCPKFALQNETMSKGFPMEPVIGKIDDAIAFPKAPENCWKNLVRIVLEEPQPGRYSITSLFWVVLMNALAGFCA